MKHECPQWQQSPIMTILGINVTVKVTLIFVILTKNLSSSKLMTQDTFQDHDDTSPTTTNSRYCMRTQIEISK